MKIVAIILLTCLFAQTCLAIPTVTNPFPINNSIVTVPPCASIGTTISNDNGTNMNITFYSNLTGVWDYFYTGELNVTVSNLANGTYYITTVFMDIYSTTYYWYVNVSEFNNDSNYYNTPIYQLTTTSEIANCTADSAFSSQTYTWIIGIIVVFSSLGILAYIKKRRKENENEN